MKKAPIPSNEAQRLAAVKRLQILDTAAEERFDRITRKATELLQVPISTITIIDSDREWFKSCQGVDQREGSREASFCGHALLTQDIFIVEDTKADPRFADNPQVTGSPSIRFYAGVMLKDRIEKLPICVFCIKDYRPRKLSLDEVNVIMELATQAEEELNQKVS